MITKQLINKIRDNKSDYLFSLGINEFDHFVRGYFYAQYDTKKETFDILRAFRDWLIKKKHPEFDKSTIGYTNILLLITQNEQTALTLFFNLWDEFQNSQEYLNSNHHISNCYSTHITTKDFINSLRRRPGVFLFVDDYYSLRGLFDGYCYAREETEENIMVKFSEWLTNDKFPDLQGEKFYHWHKILLVFYSGGGKNSPIDNFYFLWDRFICRNS